MDAETFKTSAAVISAFCAALSVSAFVLVHRSTRSLSKTQVLIQVAEWFRDEQVEEARKAIYKLDPEKLDSWITAEHSAFAKSIEDDISTWVGYLDIVSTLVLTKSLSTRDFVRMYGDVVFRTVYILAPYVNAETDKRGEQYLKSTRMAMRKMVRSWKRLSRFHTYPQIILASWERPIQLKSHSYLSEPHIASMLKR